MSGTAIPGRIVVTAKAQKRVLQALAASELGVAARVPRVDVRDDAGRLAADVTSTAALSEERGPLLAVIESTRRRLAADGERLLGADISHIAVHITDVTSPSGRVQ